MSARQFKVAGLTLFFGLFLALFIGVIQPDSTSANALWPPTPGGTNLIPDPTGGIPYGNLQVISDGCAQTVPSRQSPGFTKWISIAGAPLATSTSVPYGTTAISLEYHYAGAVCWGNSAVTDAFSYVSASSASPAGVVGGVNGAAIRLIFSPYNQIGRYAHGYQSFYYAPNGGFTTSGVYRVTLATHDANVFTSGVVGCSSGGGNIPNVYYIGSCNADLPGFDIYVTVQPPPNQPPIGTLDSADCTSLNGWAFDWDNVGRNLDIHVYYDGPAGSGYGIAYTPAGYTSVYRPDVGAAYPGAGNNHGFAIPIPNQYKDGNTHTAYAYAIGINADGTNGGTNVFIGSKTFSGCYAVDCTVTNYPSSVEPGETFSATFRITNNSAAAIATGGSGNSFRVAATYNGNSNVGVWSNYITNIAGKEARVDVPVTSLAPGASSSVTINNFKATVPNGITGITTTANGFNLSTTNQPVGTNMSFQWKIVQEGIAWRGTVCGGSIRVASKPYLKVFGNDVKAGSSFINNSQSCSLSWAYNQKASILTFAQGSGSQWTGAGGQLAALALGEIDGFVSSATRSGSSSPPAPPKGMTFGNYYDATSVYGGRGGQYGCMTDYYTTVSGNIGGTATTVGSVTLTGATDTGQFVRPSGATLPIGATTITGKKALVVDGDVYISGNVAYGAYTGPTNMPSFYLIVRGNIYIAPGVTQLNGVYVAQPTNLGAGGNIYTCANNGSFIAAGSLSSSCASQLTVNGAFLANEVKFLRTAGTLQSSAQNEIWSSSNIAEVFKSGPELYLSAPSALQRTNTSSKTYDAITSLPPVL